MTREETVAALKTAFVSMGRAAILAALAPIPFFNTIIVRQIVSILITKVLEVISNSIEMQAFFLYTDFRTNAQGRDFTQKALEYEAAKKTGDKDAMAKAEQALIISMRALINFSN